MARQRRVRRWNELAAVSLSGDLEDPARHLPQARVQGARAASIVAGKTARTAAKPAPGYYGTVNRHQRVQSPNISMTYKEQKKSGRASPEMIFGDSTVVPDPDWPNMYRVRRPDGSLTVYLARARDAARGFASAAREGRSTGP